MITKFLFDGPEDKRDQENNQYYGPDNGRNGTDDEEGADFENSFNEGFYEDQIDHESGDDET